MKILFCTPTFQTVTHGPAKFAQFVSQINELRPEHQIKIITEDYEGEAREDIYKINIYCPRPFHALIHFFRAIQYHHRAVALHKHFPFDIIVYNNAILGLWSALRWSKKIPVVGLLNDDENLRMSWSPDPEKPIRKWIIRLFFKYFERLSIQKLTSTIVCSNFLRMETIKAYKVSEEKITRLYQAVNIEALKYRERNSLSTKKRIQVLFVKSDFRRGGLWVLIEALEILESFLFELVIIGPSLMHGPKIRDRTAEIVNVQTNFLGPQKQRIVRSYLEISDILCIPALREGLGVANIEGLGAGIPIVSTNVGGIPEVLGNGDYGWLAESNNSNSLATTLKKCIESPELRKNKSQAGRQFMERQFGHKAMLDDVLSILSSL